MSNKYQFGRDSITVNGRTFPASYEVLTVDEARGTFYTVVIMATVDGGQAVRIEVPAKDKQHEAALKAAQMVAPLESIPAAPHIEAMCAAAEAAEAAYAAECEEQEAPKEAVNHDHKEEAQTMKKQNTRKYRVYFTDHPTQAATFEAANKREAEKLARQYIKAWDIPGKIERVERVDEAAPDLGPSAGVFDAGEVQQEPTTAADHSNGEKDGGTIRKAEAAPTSAPEAPEEPDAETLEEIGPTIRPNAPTTAAQAAPEAAPNPKATRGAIPEKHFKNETISGKGWSIVFDVGCNRTRVIVAEPIKATARPIVEAAGFYYSRTLDSWNKKLTFRAYRAANRLAAQLRQALPA